MKAVMKAVKYAALANLISLVFVSQSIAADAMILDFAKSNTKVDFHADGKMLKVHGENGKATGSLTIKDGTVTGQTTVDLRAMKTGIELRDDHMKNRYLEVSKFPNAILEIVEIKLPQALPNGEFTAAFKGNLTVHGVAQAVNGQAKLNRQDAQLKGEVEFTTTISGHKIDLPKYSGIVIKDEVKVKVEFDGKLMKAQSGRTVVKK